MTNSVVINHHKLRQRSALARILQPEDDVALAHLFHLIPALDDSSAEAASGDEAEGVLRADLFAQQKLVRLVDGYRDDLDENLVGADLARRWRVRCERESGERQLVLQVRRMSVEVRRSPPTSELFLRLTTDLLRLAKAPLVTATVCIVVRLFSRSSAFVVNRLGSLLGR